MSFKHGDAVKFGLEAEFLHSRYPQLIIGEISGYGANDSRVGYDAIIQAETGFTHLNGLEPGKGHKMPVALMDLLAAHQLKEGLLWAMYEREKSKKGRIVRVSLAEAGASSLANMATNTLMGGLNPQAMGSEHPNIVPYGTQYRTSDGKSIVLAVGTDKQFALLAQHLGISTEGISSNAERVRKRVEVNALLAQKIAFHQRDALLAALEALKVPAGAVRELPEVLEQPFAWRLRLENEGFAGLRTAIFAEQRYLLSPPKLNEHGDWLREEWS
jgi:crotonobetainyl-CoA:carnitine CoA-transferase CaiB-like acyl-CoA transferase